MLNTQQRVPIKHWNLKPAIDQPRNKQITDRETRWQIQSMIDKPMYSRSRDREDAENNNSEECKSECSD